MSPAAVRPRRRPKSLASRIKPFWMSIGAVAALAAAAGAFAVTWPGFRPQATYVTGNRVVTRAEILARAGIAPDRSIWLQSPRAMSARIEDIPYVATASVRRVIPSGLSIAITERAPFAVLQSGSSSVVADRALRVLSAAYGPQSLPVLVLPPGVALVPGSFITLPAARALRTVEDAFSERGIEPATLRYDRFGGLVAELHDGVRVLVGSQDDLDKKLALVKPILAQVVGSQTRVAAIDLRAPATPVVVYR